MQKSKDTDNQQVTATEEEKAWLAGLIDGEGYFAPPQLEQGSGGIRINITNQHPKTVYKAAEIVRKIGTGPRIGTRKSSKRNGKFTRVTYDVQIIGFKRLYNFLPAIIPYLTGKQNSAIAMYNLVKSRIDKGPTNKRPPGERGYSDYELSLVEAIKAESKSNWNLRDYTLDTIVNSEDIVRTI